jgi:biotin carboxyl carrier protein
MKFIGTVNKINYLINVIKLHTNYIMSINSMLYNISIISSHKNYCVLSINYNIIRIIYYNYDKNVHEIKLSINNKAFTLYLEEEILLKIKKNIHDNQNILKNKIQNIYSPIPGFISKICISINDNIKKNEPLVLIEAMKMENEIKIDKEGIIKDIFVKQKQLVEKNTLLFSIIC